jgi:hypothetical protein
MLTETTPRVSAEVTQGGAAQRRYDRRTYVNMCALDRALARSDLSAARQAFDRLQTESPFIAEALSRDPFPQKTRPLKALRVLGHCLLKGNLAGARHAIEHFH